MKTVIFTACLLLALTGFSRWENLATELAAKASQQVPQTLVTMISERFGGGVRATQPGQEKIIAANLKEVLRSLNKDQSLRDASVALKQVRFVTANAPTQDRLSDRSEEVVVVSTGYYLATINYDLMSPLTMESGATLLTAACSCGVSQVRLSDGYEVVKTFRCPDLRR